MLVAIIIIVVVGAAITAGVLLLIPPSAQSGSQPTTSSIHFISTITSFRGTFNSPQSTRASASTTCSVSTSTYPSTINETFSISANAVVWQAGQAPSIFIAPRESVFLGLNITKSPLGILGGLKSDAPINVTIIENQHNGSVFPLSGNDRILFSRANTNLTEFEIPTPISGALTQGEYAILFSNTGNKQANVTVVAPIRIVYPGCV